MSIDVTLNTNTITATPTVVEITSTPSISTLEAVGTGSSITATPSVSQINVISQSDSIQIDNRIRLSELADVDMTGIIDKSVLFYNQSTSKFLPTNSSTTISALTDGGNF